MDAILQLDGGSDIKVLQFDFSLTQYTDETGRPTGLPTGGMISLLIETTDSQILDWMISPDGKKNGMIRTVSKSGGVRVVSFEEGYCTQYNESFSHVGGDQPISVAITISVQAMEIDGIPFSTRR